MRRKSDRAPVVAPFWGRLRFFSIFFLPLLPPPSLTISLSERELLVRSIAYFLFSTSLQCVHTGQCVGRLENMRELQLSTRASALIQRVHPPLAVAMRLFK